MKRKKLDICEIFQKDMQSGELTKESGSNNMNIERRYLPFDDTQLEIRKTDSGHILVGYAAVFDSETELYPGFHEKIDWGAFKTAIRRDDVRALFNHNEDMILGRNKAKTLRLKEDDHGLRYEIDLPNTTYAKDLIESIGRGDISGSSFAFTVGEKDQEFENFDKHTLRIIKKVKLFDISPVTYPAYEDTTVALRALEIFKNSQDWQILEPCQKPAEQRPYPNEHACRLEDPEKYDTCRRGDRIADKPDSVKGKKYHVIYCKKGDGPMEQQAFRYPIKTWTAEQAGAHCKYNKGSFEAAKKDEEKSDSAKRRAELIKMYEKIYSL